MKILQKYMIGLAAGAAMAGGLSGCSNMTVRGVVEAKGDNKIFVSDVANINQVYVLNCANFSQGKEFYKAVNMGDTITAAYITRRHNVYLTVSPDTVARFIIHYPSLPADTAETTEDAIIMEMIKARRAKQAAKGR